MKAADAAVDAAGSAALLVGHGQVGGGGVGGGALRRRAPRLPDDGGRGVTQQQGLGKVGLLEDLSALVHSAAVGHR